MYHQCMGDKVTLVEFLTQKRTIVMFSVLGLLWGAFLFTDPKMGIFYGPVAWLGSGMLAALQLWLRSKKFDR